MLGDFVVCQFGAKHDVKESAGGFYQIPPKSLTYLKLGAGRTARKVSVGGKPRNHRLESAHAEGIQFHGSDYASAGGSLKKLVCFLMLFISPAASGVDILAAPLLKESRGGRCRPLRCTKTVDTVFMAVLSSGCTVFASSDNAPVIPGAQGSYL